MKLQIVHQVAHVGVLHVQVYPDFVASAAAVGTVGMVLRHRPVHFVLLLLGHTVPTVPALLSRQRETRWRGAGSHYFARLGFRSEEGLAGAAQRRKRMSGLDTVQHHPVVVEHLVQIRELAGVLRAQALAVERLHCHVSFRDGSNLDTGIRGHWDLFKAGV